MANLFCVKDKVVIITGGAGILGRGIAGHLAEEGAKIVILDRAAEVGEQIVADIKAKGGEASFFLTDVLNKEILEQNKKDILAKYGRIDALLNAAGGNMAVPMQVVCITRCSTVMTGLTEGHSLRFWMCFAVLWKMVPAWICCLLIMFTKSQAFTNTK